MVGGSSRARAPQRGACARLATPWPAGVSGTPSLTSAAGGRKGRGPARSATVRRGGWPMAGVLSGRSRAARIPRSPRRRRWACVCSWRWAGSACVRPRPSPRATSTRRSTPCSTSSRTTRGSPPPRATPPASSVRRRRAPRRAASHPAPRRTPPRAAPHEQLAVRAQSPCGLQPHLAPGPAPSRRRQPSFKHAARAAPTTLRAQPALLSLPLGVRWGAGLHHGGGAAGLRHPQPRLSVLVALPALPHPRAPLRDAPRGGGPGCLHARRLFARGGWWRSD